jgi:hypothetical protein
LRASATASESKPAKTVASFHGFFVAPSNANFTPGRAAPAAQPQAEFTTIKIFSFALNFFHGFS